MSNPRETKEFKTSGGHTIVHKTYATGREYNEIQSIYLKDAKVNVIGGVTKIEGFSANTDYDSNKKAIELLVVSVDGETNGYVEKVLDLPIKEFNEVVDLLNELMGKKTLKESESQQ